MAESRNVSAQGKDAYPTTEILSNATKPNAEIRPGHSSSCTSTPQPDFFFNRHYFTFQLKSLGFSYLQLGLLNKPSSQIVTSHGCCAASSPAICPSFFVRGVSAIQLLVNFHRSWHVGEYSENRQAPPPLSRTGPDTDTGVRYGIHKT